jgi:hypothetical protein
VTHPRRALAGLLLGTSVVLVGCTAAGPDPVPTVTPRAQAPTEAFSVVGSDDPVELAAAASRAFFEEAPVAVVTRAADPAASLTGASLAVALGVPALLAGDGAAGGALVEELDRLGTETVLVVGDAAAAFSAPESETAEPGEEQPEVDVDVVTAPEDPESLGDLLRREVVESGGVADGKQVDAVSALSPDTPTVLRLEGEPEPEPTPTTTATGAGEDAAVLPVVAETAGVDGVTVLSDGTSGQVAAVATARAAGATVLSVPGGDPRGSSDAIAAFAAAEPGVVVGLGPAFGNPEDLAWRVATAATGVELPGGTQLVFADGKRYSALYGTPGSGALGVLGEQGIPETIERARRHAEALDAHTEDRVLPSLEIIASIASAGAGPDGDYSATRPVAELKPLVDAAGEAGLYVVLDLQPGRTDFLTQARLYEELLLLPHVGLALDPEWRLKPGQVHLRQIGSVGIDEVNEVVAYLADLTRENRLPQKLLILHQFRLSMIADRERLDTSRSELAVMIHVDGQGTQPAKNDTWNVLRRNAPDVYWGWKNFYDEDVPMLTPEQTMRLEPLPHLISYQ